MERLSLWNLICEAVGYIGAVVFMALSASAISTAYVQASVYVLVAYIFIGVMRFLKYDTTGATLGVKIKRVVTSVIPSAIVLIVVSVLANYTDKYNRDFIETASEIAVAVLIGLIVLDLTYYGIKDRSVMGMNLIRYKTLSGIQKILYQVSYYLCRVLAVLGLALIVSGRSEWASAVDVGCVVWGLNKLFWMYCWYGLGNIGDARDSGDTSYVPSSNTDDDRQISDREVNSLVRKIADRWTGREDSSLLLPGNGSIRYSVNVEVIGSNIIDFTISGKLSGVGEDQLSAARIHLGSQMDKAANKIIEETKSELSKHNLPYASYDINVIKGSIE